MNFQIENAQQLQSLIAESGLSIDSIDELRDLLVDLQGQDPEHRKEELAHRERLQNDTLMHKERLQEREHAHAERLRNLEHIERLRAMEMGQPFPHPGEMDRGRSVVRAAASIGILVPLVLVAASVCLSFIILQESTSPRQVTVFGVATNFQATLFATVWGSL
jgi:hypothetical protein